MNNPQAKWFGCIPEGPREVCLLASYGRTTQKSEKEAYNEQPDANLSQWKGVTENRHVFKVHMLTYLVANTKVCGGDSS